MAKLLKIGIYLLIIILVLITGAFAYFYYSFNYFKVKDTAAIKKENLNYFQESYHESRLAFLKQVTVLKNKFPQTTVSHFYVPSKIDDSLRVDFCYIPGNDSAKLMILSSGIHGVEGYVGSAMQQFFMENYISEDFVNKTGILLIHSMNPYGFKYGRRVSENNVDLNRNCDKSPDLYKTENTGYNEIFNLINPEGKLEKNSLSNKLFFAKAIKNIAEKGMPVLRQAVLQGQYEHPTALYFGGKQLEPQIAEVGKMIDSLTQNYQSVFAIDLHTGYGERGRMHLFPNPVTPELRTKMENIFEGFQIDWGDSKDFYTITGDFVNFIGQMSHSKEFIPMVFEFGTMNSQTTMGSLKSIHTMIMENQAKQYGYSNSTDSLVMKKEFIEMYYSGSEAWKSECIEDFKSVIDKALPKYFELK